MSRVLHTTRALCPHCLAVLDAEIQADDGGAVVMQRSCPEHGEAITQVWPNAEHYEWMRSLAFPQVRPNAEALRPSAQPCPTGCGICQRHVRKPTLVEIEVTQRCNLRCPVCFMSAEAENTDVPLEKIHDFIEAIAHTAGTDTGVQLTGGEPTMRPDLAQIVWFVRARGFWGVEVNTNGLVIARDESYLQDLRAHGLTGIYLQFDGLSSEVYEHIRGVDLLEIKLRAIEHCRSQGIQVVLAMTIVSGVNDTQVGEVLRFAAANSDIIAGVALQPAFTSGRFDTTRVEPLTMGDVIYMLEEQTAGLIKVEDIWPLGCSHPLCDTGTFLVKHSQTGQTGTERMSGTDSSSVPVCPDSSSAPVCPDSSSVPVGPDSSSVPVCPDSSSAPVCPDSDVDPLAAFSPVTRNLSREEYLEFYDPDSPQGSVFLDICARKGLRTQGGLSVIIMNYMDAWTCDLERMEECSMFVTMPSGALIPFCSYQLTTCAGQRVFPPWNIKGAENGVDWSVQ